MKILVTNDDGYKAPGLQSLVRVLAKFGDLTVVAPKSAQSGMSMAVTMGFAPIAVRKLHECPGQRWWYLDGTPASCVKFGIDNVFAPEDDRPDLVVAGVNHGSNAATAALYSGTVGAAMEGAVNGIPSVALSLDDFSPFADFAVVEAHLAGVLDFILANASGKFGIFYNVNFPKCRPDEVKGMRVCPMGKGHWEKEYEPYTPELIRSMGHEPSQRDLDYVRDLEDGEDVYVMKGYFVSNPGNPDDADHLLMADNYITILPENFDNTDYNEYRRLCDII